MPLKLGADRRVSNLFVAVDLIGRGIGRRLLDHIVRLAEAEAHCACTSPAAATRERLRTRRLRHRRDPPTDVPITWLLRPSTAMIDRSSPSSYTSTSIEVRP